MFCLVFFIESYFGNVVLEFVEYSFGKFEFDVCECIFCGLIYVVLMCVKICLILKDCEIKLIKDVCE